MTGQKDDLSSLARDLVTNIEAGKTVADVGEKFAYSAVSLILDPDQNLQEGLNYIRDSLVSAGKYFISTHQFEHGIKVAMIVDAVYSTFSVLTPLIATTRFMSGIARESNVSSAQVEAKRVTSDIIDKLVKGSKGNG